VFGMSFGEWCVLVIVAIVVIGPKDLPRFLRKAGQLAGKLRRMATDVRAQSGIDEVLRSEGLTKDIAEIRRLAQGDFIDPVRGTLGATRTAMSATALAADRSAAALPEPVLAPETGDFVVVREREYPTQGADSYSAIPDTAIVYAKGLPVSPLARDPLYVTGDPEGALPPPDPEPDPGLEETPLAESGENGEPKDAAETGATATLPEAGSA
jgi:sec-independent protein translocase protein TatB